MVAGNRRLSLFSFRRSAMKSAPERITVPPYAVIWRSGEQEAPNLNSMVTTANSIPRNAESVKYSRYSTLKNSN
jgi:hypothetical protein